MSGAGQNPTEIFDARVREKKSRKEGEKMAQINLKSDKKLKKLRSDFIKEAEVLKLTDDYLFVQSFNAFENQIRLMDDLLKQIDNDGIMVVVPAGKDTVKTVVNPAVAEYNRMANLANKTSATLLGMITEKRKEIPVDADDLV